MKKNFGIFAYSYSGTVKKEGIFFTSKGTVAGHGIACIPLSKIDTFILSPYTPLEKMVRELITDDVDLQTIVFTSLCRLGDSETILEGGITALIDI